MAQFIRVTIATELHGDRIILLPVGDIKKVKSRLSDGCTLISIPGELIAVKETIDEIITKLEVSK